MGGDQTQSARAHKALACIFDWFPGYRITAATRNLIQSIWMWKPESQQSSQCVLSLHIKTDYTKDITVLLIISITVIRAP